MTTVELPPRCGRDLAAVSTSMAGSQSSSPAKRAEDLLACYDEPQRRYHTRVHLAEMLAALDELAKHLDLHADELRIARLAGWFHDAVYDPRAAAGDNERASAALAASVLTDLDALPAVVADVAGLVLATADHRVVGVGPRHRATEALLDADLWILAAAPDRFDQYCVQVRAEYAFVDEASYGAARSAILTDLARRPRLYATDLGHRRWTAPARRNIARELARLA